MEWVSGNVFIRPAMQRVSAGYRVDGHTHNFDHTTIVFSGAVHVRAQLPDNSIVERDFVAPAHFLVKADVKHEITATQDNTTCWCVYSHRDPQGGVVQQYDGWTDSYI